jgi:ClpP class serine protease
MSHQQCNRVISAQPWAITKDGLDLVLGIAQRNIGSRQAVLASPTERRESGNIQMRDGVAIISVMGPIFSRADLFSEISGATSIERLALRFGEAASANDVKGIVLHFDSQGGTVTGVHEFAGQIFAARNAKPVVAYVSGVCASAAYWLASAAGRVVADETAILGSIGVIAAWTDDTEARKSAGLTDYEVVSSQSPNKRLDPTSKEGRAALQRLLDTDADIFIADVARNRGKRVSTVAEQFGQGGVMHAAEAVKVGMADEIGSLENVIATLSGKTDSVIKKETLMNKAELAQKHPELLAQIQAEARAEGETLAKEALAEAARKGQSAALALVAAVAGEDVAEKARSVADIGTAAGVTLEQLAAMSAILAPIGMEKPQEAPAAGGEEKARAAILAAIAATTGGAVATGGEIQKHTKSALVADAERRVSAQRTV